MEPSKRPDFMQQCLKPAAGAAGAWIVTTEFFHENLVPVHHAFAAFDPLLGRETATALAHGLKSRRDSGDVVFWT